MIVYKASEIGGCTKALVAKRLQYDPTPGFGEDIPAFQLGHIIEAEVIEYLKLHNWNILDQQREYYLPIGRNEYGEEIVVQCHPDAIGTQMGSPDRYAIEIKSAAQDSYDSWIARKWQCSDLFLRYLYQISCYHYASELPVAFIVRSKPKVSSDTPKTHISIHATSPPLLTLAQIKDRVMDIETRADKYNLPNVCDYPTPDMFCPYAYLHEMQTFDERPDVEELVREYDKLVAEHNGVKKQEAGVAQRRKMMRRKILEALGCDADDEEDGKTAKIDTGHVQALAIWGPMSRPLPDWEKIMDKVDGEKKDYQIRPRYGYRLRVKVRD